MAEHPGRGLIEPHDLAAALSDDSADLSEIARRLSRDAQRLDEGLLALVPEPDRAARVESDLAALRARTLAGEAAPALLGTPVLVKDIFGLDGLPTRAGSALPAETFDLPEADIVRRLREHGAFPLAKSRTAAFAMMDPAATVNPRDSSRTPGGSSSGSAAGVAAGIAPLAIGSQTSGSVIRPASFCGVVGFKPSFGRLPTGGMLHACATVDTVGLFTRDPAWMCRAAASLLEGARPIELPDRALRVGAMHADDPSWSLAEPGTRALFEAALGRIRAAGHTVAQRVFFADFQALIERHTRLVAYEFARVHEATFAKHPELYPPKARRLVESGREVDSSQAAEGRESCAELRGRLQSLMIEDELDVLACPAAAGVATEGLASTGDPRPQAPWTHAGVPVLSLPFDEAPGTLPLGLQLAGRFGADEELLAAALLIADAG